MPPPQAETGQPQQDAEATPEPTPTAQSAANAGNVEGNGCAQQESMEVDSTGSS